MKFKYNNQLLINTLVYTMLFVAGYNTAIAQDDVNLNSIKPSSVTTAQVKQFIVGYWKYNYSKTFDENGKLVEKVFKNTLPEPVTPPVPEINTNNTLATPNKANNDIQIPLPVPNELGQEQVLTKKSNTDGNGSFILFLTDYLELQNPQYTTFFMPKTDSTGSFVLYNIKENNGSKDIVQLNGNFISYAVSLNNGIPAISFSMEGNSTETYYIFNIDKDNLLLVNLKTKMYHFYKKNQIP